MNFCGIDVSADELVVALRQGDRDLPQQRFANTAAGHRRLLAWLRGQGGATRITLEATGVYSLDIALALAAAPGREVAVVNPKLIRRFAESLDERSKDDPLDARILLEYTVRMPFRRWQPPSPTQLALRAITRHMLATTELRTATRNRWQIARRSASTPACVRRELERSLRQIDASLLRLQRQARTLVAHDPTLESQFQLLLTVPGIAELSACNCWPKSHCCAIARFANGSNMPGWTCATTVPVPRSAAGPISASVATAICVGLCSCPRWWPPASIPACAPSIKACWPAANTSGRPWLPSCGNWCTPSTACFVIASLTSAPGFAHVSRRPYDQERFSCTSPEKKTCNSRENLCGYCFLVPVANCQSKLTISRDP
jgi:Transposase